MHAGTVGTRPSDAGFESADSSVRSRLSLHAPLTISLVWEGAVPHAAGGLYVRWR